MTTVYIDEYPEYIDLSLAELCGIDPSDFDNEIVITGNRDFIDRVNAEWYKRVMSIIDDMETDSYIGQCFSDYSNYPDIDRQKRLAILTAYREEKDNLELACRIANIIFPDKHYECRIIRGSSQSEWNYVAYESEYKPIIDDLEEYYFGECIEIHWVDDNGASCIEYMNYTQFWNIEREGKLKEEISRYVDIDDDIEIMVSDGYTMVKNWRAV